MTSEKASKKARWWARTLAFGLTTVGAVLYGVTIALWVIDTFFTPEKVSDGISGGMIVFGILWLVVTGGAGLFLVVQDKVRLIVLSAIPGILFWMPFVSMILRQAVVEGAL